MMRVSGVVLAVAVLAAGGFAHADENDFGQAHGSEALPKGKSGGESGKPREQVGGLALSREPRMPAGAAAAPPVDTGVLVVAHGGDVRWNAHVKEVVARVRRTLPAEVGFLMGVPDQKAEEGYAKLVAAGVGRVVVVPLFVSSHSDHYEQVRFIGGLRGDYPHAEHMKLAQLHGPAPVASVTSALDDHPLLGAILADRARALSEQPASESLVIVAHGPNEDAEAEVWTATIRRLGEQVRSATGIGDVDVRLLRDDAPEPVKDQALAELRVSVETRASRGRVLVVPLLVAPGKVADQIPQVLAGLDFRWNGQTLLPDDRVVQWVVAQATAASAASRTAGSLRYREQLVVTATRTERPLEEIPVHTEVIGREVLEAAAARSVGEALLHSAGVEVVPSLAGESIQLQGLAGRSVLVLVDGQEVLGKIGGEVDLGSLLAHDVERIEIVKGAGSALYGSDALGGVVNVLTRQPSNPVALSFTRRFESLEGRTTEGSASLRSGRWAGSASASRISRDAYDLTPSEPATTGSDYRKLAASARLSCRFGERSAITLSARHYDEEAADVSASRATVYDDLVDDERSQLLAELRTGVGATGMLKTRGHLQRYSHDFERVSRTSKVASPDLTRERLAEAEAQYDQPLGKRHLLSVGGELEGAEMTSDRIVGASRDITTSVAYAQDEWFVNDRLRLVAGVRLDHNSAFGSAWSPKLAAMVRLLPPLRLRASVGEGFKAPEFKDLYIQFGNRAAGYQIVGNPELRPETSRSSSAGLELEMWDGRLRASVTYFRNRIDDLIEPSFAMRDPQSGLMTFQSRNVAAVRTRGTETDITIAPKRWAGFGLSHTWLDAEDRSTGEPLTLRPRHTLKARTTLRRDKTRLSLFARYLGERAFADADSDGRIDEWAPGAFVFDVNLAYDLGRTLRLVLGAENAFNERDPRFFPVAGRRLYAGLVLRYERG